MNTVPRWGIPIEHIGTPFSIIEVRSVTEFVYIAGNEAASMFFGFHPSDYLGRNMEDFSDMDERQIFQRRKTLESYRNCIATQKTVTYETRYKRADGEYEWGKHTCVPDVDSAGKVTRIYITTINVTELVQTQRRLKDSQKSLEDALTNTLSGFVKICVECKSIEQEGQWQAIEQYAAEHMGYKQFSHGLCALCEDKLYGES